MKVLIITSHLKVGGIGIYTVTLANALQRAGHTVFVASEGGGLEEELSPQVKKVNVPLGTKSVISPSVAAAVIKLRKLVREEGIDIMHAQTRVAQFTACLLTGLTKVPYVSTWHGFYRPHFFRKMFPCLGSITIAISRAVADDLKKEFSGDERKIRVISNGVDTEKFSRAFSEDDKRAIREKYGLGEGPVIGIIARLVEEKRHLMLLDAFKLLLAELPSAQLLIVGEGRMEEAVRKRAAGLGIVESVRFNGNTSNTTEFLAIMDVFARPSSKEGFGLSMAEAMLMGVPVVSTDVGGFRDMLRNGELGILVEPADAAGLKEALKKVLADKGLAKRISASAKEYARLNFSADEMAAQTGAVYMEVKSASGH